MNYVQAPRHIQTETNYTESTKIRFHVIHIKRRPNIQTIETLIVKVSHKGSTIILRHHIPILSPNAATSSKPLKTYVIISIPSKAGIPPQANKKTTTPDQATNSKPVLTPHLTFFKTRYGGKIPFSSLPNLPCKPSVPSLKNPLQIVIRTFSSTPIQNKCSFFQHKVSHDIANQASLREKIPTPKTHTTPLHKGNMAVPLPSRTKMGEIPCRTKMGEITSKSEHHAATLGKEAAQKITSKDVEEMRDSTHSASSSILTISPQPIVQPFFAMPPLFPLKRDDEKKPKKKKAVKKKKKHLLRNLFLGLLNSKKGYAEKN